MLFVTNSFEKFFFTTIWKPDGSPHPQHMESPMQELFQEGRNSYMLCSSVIPQIVQNVWIVTLVCLLLISELRNRSACIHIPQLSIQSCPNFSHSQSISSDWHVAVLFKRAPRLNILNMGSTALCEYSTALRARPIFQKIPTFYLQPSPPDPITC